MKLHAILTVTAEATTLGEVAEWIKELDGFGVSRDTELLDGANLHPEGASALMDHPKFGETPARCGNCHRCLLGVQGPFGLPETAHRMIGCSKCGNKRCPKATDHRLDCTNSNEPGQPGSVFGSVTGVVTEATGFPAPKRSTLAALDAWVSELYSVGLTPETPVLDAEDLAVDFTVANTEPIRCGTCGVLDALVSAHKHDDD
jgi:hypothetical protein